MEGRGPEFVPVEKEKTDDGFSEKKAARIIEGKQKDTQQVKKRKPILPSSFRKVRTTPRSLPKITLPLLTATRKDKILLAYKQLTVEILTLLEQLAQHNEINPRQEEQLLEDIKTKRHIQEELITTLALEVKGQFSENALSKEAWDLVK